MLEPVGKIGRVEQAEGDRGELMAGLGVSDGFREQRRTRPARVADCVALELEPSAQQFDLGRATDAIGALDNDEMAGQRLLLEIRKAMAVPALNVMRLHWRSGCRIAVGRIRAEPRRSCGARPSAARRYPGSH